MRKSRTSDREVEWLVRELLLEAMREVAKLFDHIEQEPTADNGALMDAVHAQVEKNLTVLGRLHEQLKAL